VDYAGKEKMYREDAKAAKKARREALRGKKPRLDRTARADLEPPVE